MSFKDPELNRLWDSFMKEEKGSAPGWTTVLLDQRVQTELEVGPVARVRPNLESGGCEIAAAPAVYDLTLRTTLAHMESFQGAFTAFSRGGMFKMPHNLQISHLDATPSQEDNSKHEEDLVLTRILLKENSNAEKTDPPVTLVNPSLFAMSVALKTQDLSVVVSEQYRENIERDMERLHPLVLQHRRRTSVQTFPAETPGLVYTGSLGVAGRSARWIGLQPDPFGPNVVGRHFYPWGLTYQYSRNGRTRELVFQYSPEFYRYTTKEYFGVESSFFVNTTERHDQRLLPGVGPVLGFTEDPSPRRDGAIGPVRPVGKFVLRLDTSLPERHTSYVTDGPYVHYGESVFPVDRGRMQRGHRVKVYHMRSHSWLELEFPLPECDPPGTYATFFRFQGKEVVHSDEIYNVKFGAVISLEAAAGTDQEIVQYATGLSIIRPRLPARQNDVVRERGIELIRFGMAQLRGAMLEPVCTGRVIVGSSSMTWETFFLRVHQSPLRGVLLTWAEERYLRELGYGLIVGRERRFSVFPCAIPSEGWSEHEVEGIALLDFE